MIPQPDSHPTQLLRRAAGGDETAYTALFPLIYEELRQLAQRHMRRERPGHTLSATALVHEAYLRLIGVEEMAFSDRTHFMSFASRVMRRVLVDHAKARNRAKRGGGAAHVTLDGDAGPGAATQLLDLDDLLALDEALDRLEAMDPRACRVVECRVFAGLSVEETADALGVSGPTVKRDYASARAWLNSQLT